MTDPREFGTRERSFHARFVPGERSIIEIWRILEMACVACSVDLDIQHAIGDDATLTRAGSSGVLNSVLKIEQYAWTETRIAFVDQHGASAQEIAVTLKRNVNDRVEQWMTWTDKCGQWLALRRKVGLGDATALSDLARKASIELVSAPRRAGGSAVMAEGQDITARLRTSRVERAVSIVSRVRGVRRALVQMQRQLAHDGGVVMVGRDIGTVVLPRADVKVYLHASPEKRARRRCLELRQSGHGVSYATVLKDIRRRDRLDSERAVSPLRQAPDARVVNTDGLTLEQVVDEILTMVAALECPPSTRRHPSS